MTLMGKPPLGLKTSKPKPDPWYLAQVRRLPCCICRAFGEQQLSATRIAAQEVATIWRSINANLRGAA